jgi:hypothetical protein
LLTLANKFSKRHVLSVFSFLFNYRLSLRNPWVHRAADRSLAKKPRPLLGDAIHEEVF